MEFRVPSSIPQDLQIIQDLIGEVQPPPTVKSITPETTLKKSSEDSVESSDNESDTDSEREVEADILEVLDSEADSTPPMYVSSHRKAQTRIKTVQSCTGQHREHKRFGIIIRLR